MSQIDEIRKFKVTPSDRLTRLQFSTTRVKVKCIDGSLSFGTGFFYDSGTEHYFVTNKHVVEDASIITFQVHQANNELPQYVYLDKRRMVDTTLDQWVVHPSKEIDLAFLPITELLSINKSEYLSDFYVPLHYSKIPDDEVISRFSVAMDITMIGCPNSLWDEYNSLPIIRQGITGSHASLPFNGKDEVVIDMACFPGSSGSPIILHDPRWFASSPRFLGILYAGPVIDNKGEVLIKKIPTSQYGDVKVKTTMHLGFAIKSQVLRDFIMEYEFNKYSKQKEEK